MQYKYNKVYLEDTLALLQLQIVIFFISLLVEASKNYRLYIGPPN